MDPLHIGVVVRVPSTRSSPQVHGGEQAFEAAARPREPGRVRGLRWGRTRERIPQMSQGILNLGVDARMVECQEDLV
jgi:hypothetical protein